MSRPCLLVPQFDHVGVGSSIGPLSSSGPLCVVDLTRLVGQSCLMGPSRLVGQSCLMGPSRLVGPFSLLGTFSYSDR
jgi:hypothetical protein